MTAPGRPEIGRIEPGHVPAGYLAERQPNPWGSRPVHWVLTAAVLAAVVSAYAWPWPTLGAVGAAAGAVSTIAGIRSLIRGPKTTTAPENQQASTIAHGGLIRARDVDDLAGIDARAYDDILTEVHRRQRVAQRCDTET
ncbi:hypothetical protein V2S66_31530 [Streptomyces sp. V4-01]|uniref:Uncharacterized protein n=1 Tax=Actinacidiphila polyblastidii TaxID=3110430 RepID=A0ABU7PMJ8_9ACTN|nr:hypothetical protein [Streptomyces sp. V4-01]